MKNTLGKEFFNRKTINVAQELLGKYLVREIGGEEIAEKIVETEAYVGAHDLACHSSRGKTERNSVMYEEAGTIYVYFTYGMHWMLNIVTEERDCPTAVLIRGTEHITGPARLTKALSIDKKLNKQKLGKKSGLWIEDRGVTISPRDVKKTPRIGVSYAGIWAKKKLRFVLK